MTILKVAMGIFFAVMLVDAHVPAATSTSTSTSTSEVEKLIASLSYCSGAESPLLRTVKGSPLLSCRRSSTSFTLFVLLSNKQSDSIERCLWYPITMATPIVGKMLELDKIYSTLIYIYDLGAFGLNLSSSYGGTLVCCSTFLNWFIARQEFPSSSDCQSNCKPPYRSRSSSGNSSSFVASPAELNNFLASFRLGSKCLDDASMTRIESSLFLFLVHEERSSMKHYLLRISNYANDPVNGDEFNQVCGGNLMQYH